MTSLTKDQLLALKGDHDIGDPFDDGWNAAIDRVIELLPAEMSIEPLQEIARLIRESNVLSPGWQLLTHVGNGVTYRAWMREIDGNWEMRDLSCLLT